MSAGDTIARKRWSVRRLWCLGRASLEPDIADELCRAKGVS